MVKNLANKAMTTHSQKACNVIDHLIKALGNDPSSSLRRAQILVDIDQYPGTNQSDIMDRLDIHKSALNREIDWLFNYGCIMRAEGEQDARTIRLEVCGYSKNELEKALDYFDGDHEHMKAYLEKFEKMLPLEKPSLRDAKIIFTVYNLKEAEKNDINRSLYGHPASSTNRALNKLIETGVISGDAV